MSYLIWAVLDQGKSVGLNKKPNVVALPYIKIFFNFSGRHKTGREESLSINTYGGTEIPVFQRYVAGMIERAVAIEIK